MSLRQGAAAAGATGGRAAFKPAAVSRAPSRSRRFCPGPEIGSTSSGRLFAIAVGGIWDRTRHLGGEHHLARFDVVWCATLADASRPFGVALGRGSRRCQRSPGPCAQTSFSSGDRGGRGQPGADAPLRELPNCCPEVAGAWRPFELAMATAPWALEGAYARFAAGSAPCSGCCRPKTARCSTQMLPAAHRADPGLDGRERSGLVRLLIAAYGAGQQGRRAPGQGP